MVAVCERARCHAAFSKLEENMTLVEQVLAQQFWCAQL